SRYLVATLFQQREELLKLAGVGRMRRPFEMDAIELGNRCSILLSYGTSTGRCSIADGATHPLG
ncbi:MAG: hypothetical protein WCD64_12880, partial [Pseudolabrys sp.]